VTREDFNPQPLIEKLVDANVNFIVIGGVAAVLHGSPVVTFDFDIAYERTTDNLERLAAVLAAVKAKLRGVDPDLPLTPDARALKSGANFTFDTELGEFDCLGWPDGINSYSELLDGALEQEIGGRKVLVASIDDLIRMKSAAGRPKDEFGILHLREIQKMQDGD